MFGLRVLIVGENREDADLLTRLVQGCSNATRTVYDFVSVLSVAETFQPHLTFLDLGMPFIRGFLLARRFREVEALQGTRLVAVTGYVDAACRNLAADVGFDDFLLKPFSKRSIELLLADVLRRGALETL